MHELVLRLAPGADLRRALEAECRTGLPHGGFVVCGIGSLADPVLRLAGQEDATRYEGPFEILTLCGTVTADGAHLHASVSSAQGKVFGGHVLHGCQVRTTAEILVVALETWSLRRAFDAATGSAELAPARRPPGGP